MDLPNPIPSGRRPTAACTGAASASWPTRRSSASTFTASFPSRPPSGTIRRAAAQFLKLMSASLALAGVGACTKQPTGTDRSLCQAARGPRPGPAALLRERDPVLRRRPSGAGREPHGSADQDRRQSRTSGQSRCDRRLTPGGRSSTSTTPIARRRHAPRRSRGVGRASSTAMQSAPQPQKAQAGSGSSFPDRADHLALAGRADGTILADFPQARWHQYDPVASAGARPTAATGAPSRSTTSTRPTSSSRSTPTSSCGPGIGALPAGLRWRAARDRRAEGHESSLRVESTPSLTGIESRPPAARCVPPISRGSRVNSPEACGAGSGGAAPPANGNAARPGTPDLAKWIAAVAKDLQAHRGRSLVVAGRLPARRRSCPCARDEPVARQRRHDRHLRRLDRCRRRASAGVACTSSSRRWTPGRSTCSSSLGVNPVFTAPADLKFPERLAKVATVVYHGLYADETAYLSHWNIARHAPTRELGRRARLRRHRIDHAAADRAALRRAIDPRSARRVHDAAESSRLRHRQGLLDARVRRWRGMDDPRQRTASRSRTRRRSGATCCTTGSSPARRWRMEVRRRLLPRRRKPRAPRRPSCRRSDGRCCRCRRGRAAGTRRTRWPCRTLRRCTRDGAGRRRNDTEPGHAVRRSRRPLRQVAGWRSSSGPIPRSGTAASPTTAGCRSCRSR